MSTSKIQLVSVLHKTLIDELNYTKSRYYYKKRRSMYKNRLSVVLNIICT